MNLLQYGWNETFAAGLSGIGAGPEQVGRVIADFGEQMRIMTKEDRKSVV